MSNKNPVDGLTLSFFLSSFRGSGVVAPEGTWSAIWGRLLASRSSIELCRAPRAGLRIDEN